MSTSSFSTHRFVPLGAAVAVAAVLGLGSAAVWPHPSAHSVAPARHSHHLSQHPATGLLDRGSSVTGGKVMGGF